MFRIFLQVRHDIDTGTGTGLAVQDGSPDFVDFALVNTESLDVSSTHSRIRHTHRSDPFLASTLYARPIKVPNLGSALFVGTDDLASNIPILEDRFHPCQLTVSVIPR